MPNDSEFDRELQKHFAKLFRAAVELQTIRHSVNRNYRLEIGAQKYFLRAYRPGKNSRAQIMAEHAYLRFLCQRGFGVAQAVELPDDETCTEFKRDDGSSQFLALFEFVAGGNSSPTDREFIPRWAKALADLHSAARSFKSQEKFRRSDWREHSWVRNLRDLLNESITDSGMLESLLRDADDADAFLSSLETNENSYGLVHYDLHPGNILVDGKCLTVIDFDDCCYHWYAWDLAMPLHRIRQGHMAENNLDLRRLFLDVYRETCPVDLNIVEAFERIRHLHMIGWLAERRTEEKWREIFPKYVSAHALYARRFPWVHRS